MQYLVILYNYFKETTIISISFLFNIFIKLIVDHNAEDGTKLQDEMENLLDNDENESNDDFSDFEEDNNNGIVEDDDHDFREEKDDNCKNDNDYNILYGDADHNDSSESDNDYNLHEENSIVDASMDINHMPNINEGASYFETSTSALLFCWMQKHNICKFNFNYTKYIYNHL